MLYNFDGNIFSPHADVSDEALLLIKNLSSDGLENFSRKELLLELLQNYPVLKKACADFTESLKANGDLAENLIKYIKSLVK